jgi:hypothetical protein
MVRLLIRDLMQPIILRDAYFATVTELALAEILLSERVER